MSEQPKTGDAGEETGRLPPDERRTLLDELQRLYHQIWSRIWTQRFRESERDYNVAKNPDILGSINRHIERAVKANRKHPGLSPRDLDLPQEEGFPPSAESKPVEAAHHAPGGPGMLSDYLQTRDRLTAVQPHLGDQMRESTWKHLVASMRLAQQGDEKGAKVHAELAHNAMKEASIYLTDEEYAAFEAEVKERLATLMEPD